jgi:hypothetical protein
MPLELEAGVRPVGDELEVVSSTHVDQPRARDDAQHAWHDPHAQRADRPRPARARQLDS